VRQRSAYARLLILAEPPPDPGPSAGTPQGYNAGWPVKRHTGGDSALTRLGILAYLSRAYYADHEAEVSGVELQHELNLDATTVRSGVAELAREGLVEWDPLLSNIWLRITDKGLAAASRQPHGTSPTARG
jgi:hypothetical protein